MKHHRLTIQCLFDELRLSLHNIWQSNHPHWVPDHSTTTRKAIVKRGEHSNRHRIKQSKQNTQGYNWHRYRGRGTREGLIDHVIEHKRYFWIRLQRSFSDGRQGREWEREGKSERERGVMVTFPPSRDHQKRASSIPLTHYLPHQRRDAYSFNSLTIYQRYRKMELRFQQTAGK